MSQNPHELAGVSSDGTPDEAQPDEAREVFPIRFEKDYMDFSIQEEPDPTEGPLVPKSSSAPASVDPPGSVTGLEDVSSDDTASPAPPNAEKDKNQTPS